MKKYFFIIMILICASCKLFEAEDTTDPIVNLTIEGGNEISREVTLYLDIDDDSKIESVSIMIDDTTAYTAESNFDTIRFDVTPFADESEHILFAVVEDSEGNIGESDKLDVVITEFPGWRKYINIEYIISYQRPFIVDENGLIWIGTNNGVLIFDPISYTSRVLYDNDDDPPGYSINDIEVIEGSRVWILNDYHLIEYHYELNKILKKIFIPHARHNYPYICALDDNYNLYIGTSGSDILKYNGADFKFIDTSGWGIWDMEFHPNGTLYYFNEWGYQGFIINDEMIRYNDYPYKNGSSINSVVIDKSGNVWLEGTGEDYGCYLYDGSNWQHITTNNSKEIINPVLSTSDDIMYTVIEQIVDQRNILKSYGLVTYNTKEWTYFYKFDNPINVEDTGYNAWERYKSIDEAPNGDIWMVLDNVLWRYRPSLGGYP